jgi:hypothetical protein
MLLQNYGLHPHVGVTFHVISSNTLLPLLLLLHISERNILPSQLWLSIMHATDTIQQVSNLQQEFRTDVVILNCTRDRF